MQTFDTHIISEFPRKEDKVCLGLRAYKGKAYFDVRVWFVDQESKAWVPSRKGLCLDFEYLPQMRGYLDKLESLKDDFPADFAAELALTASEAQENHPSKQSQSVDKPKGLTPDKEKRYDRPKTASKPFTRHF